MTCFITSTRIKDADANHSLSGNTHAQTQLRLLLLIRDADLLVFSSPLFKNTVSLLRGLKHSNIVTLHDIIHTDKSLTLVFEYLVRKQRKILC